MDYKTFVQKFPSDAFLAVWAITVDEYKKAFVKQFNTRGPLACGLSDVGISELYEKGAIVVEGEKLCLLPEKFDATERYNREVRGAAHEILHLMTSLIHRMQDGLVPVSNITLWSDGSVEYDNGRKLSNTDVHNEVGMVKDAVAALVADMRAVLADESLVWKRFGTFSVVGDRIVCVPNPTKPKRGIEVEGDWELATSIE